MSSLSLFDQLFLDALAAIFVLSLLALHLLGILNIFRLSAGIDKVAMSPGSSEETVKQHLKQARSALERASIAANRQARLEACRTGMDHLKRAEEAIKHHHGNLAA